MPAKPTPILTTADEACPDPSVIYIFTDGSAALYDGTMYGGWAAVLRFGNRTKEISGGAANTTISRMEMTAIYEALSTLREAHGYRVQVVSDSQYCVDALTRHWRGWQENNWRTASGSEVAHLDLIQAILPMLVRSVSLKWIKGHNGHELNDRADVLATNARKAFLGDTVGKVTFEDVDFYNPREHGRFTVGSNGKSGFLLRRGKTVLELTKQEARDIGYDLVKRAAPDPEAPVLAVDIYSPERARAIENAHDARPSLAAAATVARIRTRTTPPAVKVVEQ